MVLFNASGRGRRSRCSARRRAFTLVELIVSAGIIVVLTALLVGSIPRAVRSARQVRCQSNLRQWTGAAIAYAMDHDGALPRRGQGQQPTAQVSRPEDWFNALPPLMQMEPYSSLSARNAVPRAEDWRVWSCDEAKDVGQVNFFCYAMNMRLSTWLTPEPDRINGVGPPETMVFLADGPVSFCSALPANAAYSPVARHAGRVNISFVDGHVAAFTGAEVGCGVGDPLRNDVRWMVPGSTWAGPN